MPYKHAGEIGDIWKHLPLCDILAIEKPLRYFETNSAYSGYTLTENSNIKYGILSLLKNDVLSDSKYLQILRNNNIENMHYTGSPGLAMNILSDKTDYFFYDIEEDALNDIYEYVKQKGLTENIHLILGDSIEAFMKNEYLFNKTDFIFIDPYTPFDKNKSGNSFFDIFEKASVSGAKTLLWYGYETLKNKRQISESLNCLAHKSGIKISSYDIWLKCMDEDKCIINPGVPGCGLACANLSASAIDILNRYIKIIEKHYENALYYGYNASLFSEVKVYDSVELS